MNKQILSLMVFGLVFLTGCLNMPQNYTPRASLQLNRESPKYDLTFSLEYEKYGDEIIGKASEGRFREIIEEQLRKSGYFSSVTYKPLKEKSDYHIHFIAHYTTMPVDESMTQGLCIGYTLALIPSWVNMYLDLSAVIIHQNQKVFARATAENLRCYIWLPLMPFGMVWNSWLAWTRQEKNCINYLLNQMTDFQKRQLEQQTAEESDSE